MIKPADIYAVTNYGLDIIQYYFPEAKPGKPFKMREESTPSAFVKLFGDVYKCTDFGDDGVPLSPIDIVMREERKTFGEAIYFLAGKHGLSNEISASKNKPDVRQREPNEDEKDGTYDYELNEQFTTEELKLIGPHVTNEHCKALGYHSVKWYSVVKSAGTGKDGLKKDRRVTIISSNENYPIFLRNCGTFQKVYQPLNPDKQYRFFYIGKKDHNFINGLEELKTAYRDYNSQAENTFNKDNPEIEGKDRKSYSPQKYPEAVICSGERDALNCKSFGYQPIWFNSETYQLQESDYKEIMKYVEKLYNIPDIDETGKRKACELALNYPDILTVWLPESLKEYKDNRGKARKDLRDYVELRSSISEFKKLLDVSMPAIFWEWKETPFGKRLELNSEYLRHFLKINGYFKMPFAASKAEQLLIQVKDSVVKQVNGEQIRDYIKNWLRKRYYPVSILNLVNNSKRVGDASLAGLDEFVPDFKDYGSDYQYMFFRNTAIKVTANEVKPEKYKGLIKNVWEPLVLQQNFKRIDPSFTASWNAEKKEYDFLINHKKSRFFCFLINASRVFWREELETSWKDKPAEEKEKYCQENKFEIEGPVLSESKQKEQKLHLFNKIFSIGYLLHSWKAKHRAWALFAMDHKISDEGTSNGRSGKSFCIMSLANFKESAYISGRNQKLQDNKHMFEEITELTRLLIINDAHRYFPLDIFFDIVTEKMSINPKFGKQFTLPFELAPKIAITTNFASRNRDDSTQARLLYTLFSDYYHEKTENNDFLETRKIYDDFNKQLQAEDYTEDEWNADFNFYADCLSFYISTIPVNRKIYPPMENVIRRNLREGMGDAFKSWADSYFSIHGDNINKMLVRKDVMREYETSYKKESPQVFMDRLEMWARYTKFVKGINPKQLINTKDGRIFKKIEGVSYEMLYVETIELDEYKDLIESELKNEDNEDLPF